MKLNFKSVMVCMLVLLAVCLAGCEQTPYEINDSENYNVSVQFDANGGVFTDNTPIIVDSYNISGLAVNAEGKAEIALLAPNDPLREKDAFTPYNNGCFLAGWYAECTQTTDAEGNVTCTYSKPWNFETDRLTVDPNAGHSANEPVLTLYAAWAPLYEIEFYDLNGGTLLSSFTFSPAEVSQIQIPHWDDETGTVKMYEFPKQEGCTFNGVYYDADGKKPVKDDAITHPAVLNTENATVEDLTLQLYVDYREGEWFRIYNAKQFADNFKPNGSYEICADLDFADAIWPTAAMYGSFEGTIKGNGHTISNVNITQTDNSKIYAGLFGQIGENAVMNNLKFKDITFTVKNGTRVAGTAYGLLCGSLSDGAKLSKVQIQSGKLLINSGCYFGTDDYVIGLLCGMGDPRIDYSGITCEATGDTPENVVITVTENTVSVEFVTQ